MVGEVTLVVEQQEADPSQEATLVHSPRQGCALFDDVAVIAMTPRVATPVTGQKTFALTAAETLCKYTLVQEIARGGMGQIYFGEDPQHERQVALKVSSVSEAGEDPRFTKEAKVLALLAHPNIVPIYNVGVDAQGRPFFSMKLVKGRTQEPVLKALKEGNTEATTKPWPFTPVKIKAAGVSLIAFEWLWCSAHSQKPLVARSRGRKGDGFFR